MQRTVNSGVIKRAIETNGDVREILARLFGLIGMQLLAGEDGRPDDAVEVISRAIDLEPYDHELFRERSLAYIAENDFDRAAEDLSRAIRLEPGKLDYYAIRGVVYLRKGDYDGAIANLGVARPQPSRPAQLEDLEPEAVTLYLAIAYLLRSMNSVAVSDMEAARRDFEKAEALAGEVACVTEKFREVHGLFGDLRAMLAESIA